MINLGDQEEKQQISDDFRSALLFAKKLDEIEFSSEDEPLENVLDFYGGNHDKMRYNIDEEEAQEHEVVENIKLMKSINKNMRGNLCVAPKAFIKNE